MAVGGRKPVPTAIKILQGNPGKRPLNADEPKPDPTAPACPDWLSAQAKREWAKLAPELTRLGLLTVVDEGVLAGYCSALAEFHAAETAIERDGRTIVSGGIWEPVLDADGKEVPDGKGGVVVRNRGGQLQPHPAVAMQRSAWKAVQQFAALFGLDPSSRCRLKAGKPSVAAPSGLKAFIGGKKA